MSQNKTGEFGSIEATHRLWVFFTKQVQLLEQARISTMQESTERWSVLTPLLYAAIDTSGSVLSLAQTGKVRDCFVLARTAFETIVNICFICAKGDEVARRAKNHALQKAYRDLSRELNISGQKLTLKWIGEIKSESNPELQAALAEFTSKKGREITSWTPETVQEQIETVDACYGKRISIHLQFALMSIYRHASEIAHGTYFGALFALGLTSPSGPPKSPEALQNYQRQNLSMLLMMLGLATSALIKVLAEEIPSLSDLVTESEKAVKEIQNEAWLEK
jgi:hypothetical protein